MQSASRVDSFEHPIFEKEANSERKFLIRQVVGLLGRVDEQTGPVGRKILEQFAQGRITLEEFQNQLEATPDFSEFCQRVYEYLEKEGLLTRKGEDFLVDIHQLTTRKSFTLEAKKIKNNTKNHSEEDWIKTDEPFHHGRFVDMLQNAFWLQKVYNLEEYRAWENDGKSPEKKPENKSLFYTPQSTKEAFDKNAIQDAQFHILPAEMSGKKGSQYSDTLVDEKFDEVSLACLVYHPQYGDGKREGGTLFVRDQKTRKYKKISSDWFREWGMHFVGEPHKSSIYKFLNSPKFFLAEGGYKNLSENKLLTPGDFQTMAGSQYAKKYGTSRDITQSQGMVMVDKVRYTLGTAFAPSREKKYRMYQLSDTVGGIVSIDPVTGEERYMTHVFDMVAKEDPRRTDTVLSIPQAYLNLRKFNPEEGKRLFEEHLTGGEAFEFASLIELKQKLAKKANVSFESLSPGEQAGLLLVYRNCNAADREKMDTFLETKKEAGLSVLLLGQYQKDLFSLLEKIGQKYSVHEQAALFEKIAEVIRSLQMVEERVKEFFVKQEKEVNISEIAQEIMKRAGKLVEKFAHEPKATIKISELVMRLETIKEDIMLFAVTFKTAFKGKGYIDVKEITGMDLQHLNCEELTDNDKQEMYDIIKKNWSNRDAYGKKKIQEFYELMKTDKNSRYYVMRKDGRITSFIRFKDKEKVFGEPVRKEGGYFNVDPDYRGSGFGEAMMLASIIKEGETGIIDAVVHPDFDVGMRYVEETGCDIVGFGPDKVGTMRLILECDVQKNKKSFTRTKTKEELFDLIDDEKIENKIRQQKQVIALEFSSSVPQDGEKIKILTRAGYRGTRYFNDRKGKGKIIIFELDEEKRIEVIHSMMTK